MGFHDHEWKILGKRPAEPYENSVKPFIAAGSHFRSAAYERTAPIIPVQDIAPNMTWPMDHNDEAGDCVVAGMDHLLEVVYGLLGVPRTNWTDAQLLAFYQTQNPHFTSWSQGGGPNDNGMNIQDFLTYLTKAGVILGFARINHIDESEMRAATYLGLGILTGQMMQVAQQNQSLAWDYVANSPDWGGHCTVSVGYMESPNVEQWVSWGALYDVTPAFISHQMDEAWLVITQAHVNNVSFRKGFDLQSFGEEFTALTGRPFPFQPEPQPTPAPAPAKPKATESDRALYKAYLELHDAMGHMRPSIHQYTLFTKAEKEWFMSKDWS